MHNEVDRDLQRKRKEDDHHRPIMDSETDRDIIEFSKYRDLIEYARPEFKIIPKRKLVK